MDARNLKEHMEVIGADGVHVGTVDRVENGRIKLTKNDSGVGHQPRTTITSTPAWWPISKAIRCSCLPMAMSPSPWKRIRRADWPTRVVVKLAKQERV